jgi:hypothetical protein
LILGATTHITTIKGFAKIGKKPVESDNSAKTISEHLMRPNSENFTDSGAPPAATPYNGGMDNQLETHPFSRLDPLMVLDAVDSVGLRGDGRLLALNSYENRVYRVGREEGQPVVVKFYRPERWSDAAILEEHAFTQELADAEVPVVPAQRAGRAHAARVRRLPLRRLFPAAAGARPSCPTRSVLEWIGRFIGRIHAVGRAKPSASARR